MWTERRAESGGAKTVLIHEGKSRRRLGTHYEWLLSADRRIRECVIPALLIYRINAIYTQSRGRGVIGRGNSSRHIFVLLMKSFAPRTSFKYRWYRLARSLWPSALLTTRSWYMIVSTRLITLGTNLAFSSRSLSLSSECCSGVTYPPL